MPFMSPTLRASDGAERFTFDGKVYKIPPTLVVLHMFYGGMSRAKAEKSLRLFAEKVLPAVQAMPTQLKP